MRLESTNVDRSQYQNSLQDRKVIQAIDAMLAIDDPTKRNRANKLLHGILERLEDAIEVGHQTVERIERNNLRDFIERYK